MKNTDAVLIDTADLLMVIAEAMIAGSLKSLPGRYCQMQAIMLMAISRGLLETVSAGMKRRGSVRGGPCD